MRVLIKRTGAFGDVVLVTPVTRRLREELGPDAVIDVVTQYPQVFECNFDVDYAGVRASGHYDRFYDLDGSYEKRLRRVHGIACYMEDVFGDQGGDWDVIMPRCELPRDLADDVDWRRAVVIHPAVSWRNRTLPLTFWQTTAFMLIDRDYQVVVMGTMIDRELRGVCDTRARLSPRGQAELIRRSRCYIGSDSGPMVLLLATDTPGVVLFTISDPELNVFWRHGSPDWRFRPIRAKVPCVGCAARIDTPVSYHGCEREDYACVDTFDPLEVVVAATDLMACG